MARGKINLPINLVSLAAIALVIAFFLPWYLRGPGYSGYEIPEIVRAFKESTSFKVWTGRFDYRVYLIYSLYVIPLGAVVTLLLLGLKKKYQYAAWPTAIIPLTGFLYGVIAKGPSLFSKIGLGGWITVAAALVMLLALLKVLKLPGRK